jgi:hypothetical protein
MNTFSEKHCFYTHTRTHTKILPYHGNRFRIDHPGILIKGFTVVISKFLVLDVYNRSRCFFVLMLCLTENTICFSYEPRFFGYSFYHREHNVSRLYRPIMAWDKLWFVHPVLKPIKLNKRIYRRPQLILCAYYIILHVSAFWPSSGI